MTLALNHVINSIHFDIQLHPAWIGRVSGLSAEKLLRNRDIPYLYVLRKGEMEMDYYVTFIDADLNICHRPFVLTQTVEGWHYENGGFAGPFMDETIDVVLYKIMHCQEGECTAFITR